jgi:hypothetical protein
MDNFNWWTPVHAIFLVLTADLPQDQRENILRKLRGSARMREEKGDLTTAYFLRDLRGRMESCGRPPFEEALIH